MNPTYSLSPSRARSVSVGPEGKPHSISRNRSLSHCISTGDTFTLLHDSMRLQADISGTIQQFSFKGKTYKELSSQIQHCDNFVTELIDDYKERKKYLETKQYFSAFMEYIQVLNRTSEFIFQLKEKGLLTRMKNAAKYKEASRVYAIEIGNVILILQSLLSERTSRGTSKAQSPYQQKSLVTINGTLKLLHDNLFKDSEANLKALFPDWEFDEEKIRTYKISRRNIRRNFDSPPRTGSNFSVYKARHNNSIVAEKVFTDVDSKFLIGMQQEVMKWIQLRANSYVAWIHGLWVEGSSLGIITDYYEAGSLQHLIGSHIEQGTELDLLTKLRFTYNLIEGVNSLHTGGLVHAGLTPRSLLITPSLTLQFAGFDTIQLRLLSDQREKYLSYAPPEILINEDPTKVAFTISSDIYCLGMVLYCIWTTSFPYISIDKNQTSSLRKHIAEGNKPSSLDTLPDNISIFISKCLSLDPASRPTSQMLEEEMRTTFTNTGATSGQTFPTLQVPILSPTISDWSDLSTEINSSGYSMSTPMGDDMEGFGNLIDGFNRLHITHQSSSRPSSPALSKRRNASHTNIPDLYPGNTFASHNTSFGSEASCQTNSSSNDEASPQNSGISLVDAIQMHKAQHYEKAYAYFLYLCEVEGNPEALYYVGLYLYSGKPGFLAPDVTNALNYLQRAAKSGCGDAFDWLGLHYLDREQDMASALIHFQAAAKLLSAPGCYHLSQCYKNGHGTPTDLTLALYHLKLAAGLGYGPALNILEQELGSFPSSPPTSRSKLMPLSEMENSCETLGEELIS